MGAQPRGPVLLLSASLESQHPHRKRTSCQQNPLLCVTRDVSGLESIFGVSSSREGLSLSFQTCPVKDPEATGMLRARTRPPSAVLSQPKILLGMPPGTAPRLQTAIEKHKLCFLGGKKKRKKEDALPFYT